MQAMLSQQHRLFDSRLQHAGGPWPWRTHTAAVARCVQYHSVLHGAARRARVNRRVRVGPRNTPARPIARATAD